jgi:hypothetical protein
VLRPEQIAQLSLRWKGVVLDSLMEDRALTMAFSKNENSSKALGELQGLRTQLAKIAFDQNKKEEENAKEAITQFAEKERQEIIKDPESFIKPD